MASLTTDEFVTGLIPTTLDELRDALGAVVIGTEAVTSFSITFDATGATINTYWRADSGYSRITDVRLGEPRSNY